MDNIKDYYRILQILDLPIWLDQQGSYSYLNVKNSKVSYKQNQMVGSSDRFNETQAISEVRLKEEKSLNYQKDNASFNKGISNNAFTLNEKTNLKNNKDINQENYEISLRLIHYIDAKILLLYEYKPSLPINQYELLQLSDNLILKLNYHKTNKVVDFNWPFNTKFAYRKEEFLTAFSVSCSRQIKENNIDYLIIFGAKLYREISGIPFPSHVKIIKDLPDFDWLLIQKKLRITVWNRLCNLSKN